MKKNILSLMAIVFVVLLVTACTEEEIRPANDTLKGIAGNIR